jgi:4-hydroxy-tetrahydrodipicolinate synthase
MSTSTSSPESPRLSGVWLPIVTPFLNGKVDFDSYDRLLDHYLPTGIAGLIPLGTTGESPTVDDDEFEAIVARTVERVDRRLPVFIGVGGNATHKVVKQLRRLERYPFEGILSVCPYYNRPSQSGMLAHFRAISAATDRRILIYNIPYRTGVNLANDSLFELSELPNIVGVKDSSGSLEQSLDLLKRRPAKLSVLTGEDLHFHTMLANGADGGILAAAHMETQRFIKVFELTKKGALNDAQALWKPLEPMIATLFAEPNPMPLKHWLWRKGLIASRECRLPLDQVSSDLARRLDAM